MHDLEAKFLDLKTENDRLKQNKAEQEQKLRQAATKIARIREDVNKKFDLDQGNPRGTRRDVEMETKVEELQSRLAQVSEQNSMLKQKVRLLPPTAPPPPRRKPHPLLDRGRKLQAPQRKPARPASAYPPHRSISPRTQASEAWAEGRTEQGDAEVFDMLRAEVADRETILHLREEQVTHERAQLEANLQLAKLEVEQRDQVILQQQQQLLEAQQEIERIRQENALALEPLRNETHQQLEQLQADLKEKSMAVGVLKARYEHLEAAHTTLLENHTRVIAETDKLRAQLGQEQDKRLELKHQLDMGRFNEDRIKEAMVQMPRLDISDTPPFAPHTLHPTPHLLILAMVQITTLTQEKEALEKENANLMAVALAAKKQVEAETQGRFGLLQRELEDVRAQGRTLTQELAAAKRDLGTAQADLLAARKERDALQLQNFELLEQHRLVAERMDLLAAQGTEDRKILEEALGIVRKYRASGSAASGMDLVAFLTGGMSLGTGPGRPLEEGSIGLGLHDLQQQFLTHTSFCLLFSVGDVLVVQVRQELHDLQQQFVALGLERDRVTDMLANEKALHTATGRRLEEANQRLAGIQRDIEAAKRDLATQKVAYEGELERMRGRLRDRRADALGMVDEAVELAEGENLVKITLIGATLSGAHFGDGASLSTLAAVDFFMHDTQATQPAQGLLPDFNFMARYRVTSDAFLLHYMHTHPVEIQLFRCDRGDIVLAATAELRLNRLLTSGPSLECDIDLRAPDMPDGAVVGRLHVAAEVYLPLQQAVPNFESLLTAAQAYRCPSCVEGDVGSRYRVVWSVPIKSAAAPPFPCSPLGRLEHLPPPAPLPLPAAPPREVRLDAPALLHFRIRSCSGLCRPVAALPPAGVEGTAGLPGLPNPYVLRAKSAPYFDYAYRMEVLWTEDLMHSLQQRPGIDILHRMEEMPESRSATTIVNWGHENGPPPGGPAAILPRPADLIIGAAQVPLGALVTGPSRRITGSYPLMSPKGEPRGEVTLEVYVLPQGPPEEEEEATMPFFRFPSLTRPTSRLICPRGAPSLRVLLRCRRWVPPSHRPGVGTTATTTTAAGDLTADLSGVLSSRDKSLLQAHAIRACSKVWRAVYFGVNLVCCVVGVAGWWVLSSRDKSLLQEPAPRQASDRHPACSGFTALIAIHSFAMNDESWAALSQLFYKSSSELLPTKF
ncbi:putative Protein fantom [Paratrimastix pyriformis]|uniref:RPGR-interacting protein 1 first C2 domain-containing protein n=1 Tax=Paratrimastix pyriformis TaxID=342808 RepID=A0ABQ8UCB3_9EUKA|nr:putative Protein fantom [Paratrimastix pyriformis]